MVHCALRRRRLLLWKPSEQVYRNVVARTELVVQYSIRLLYDLSRIYVCNTYVGTVILLGFHEFLSHVDALRIA